MRYSKFCLLFILSLALFSCSEEDPNEESIAGPGVFYTSSGSATIEGELFLPVGSGPFPVMIIVPGSGNEPRTDLEQVVDIILPNGYAVYLYDKRGVGGSTGSYTVETPETVEQFLTDRSQDVLGIIDLMMTHEDIDTQSIGLFGSSQGAWVNSLVYEQSPSSLKYIVMASGGVASTGIEGYYCSLTDDPNVTIEEATSLLASYQGNSGFDPIDIIEGMSIPVLWIYGNDDRSHPARYDVDVLNGLSKPNFTIHLYQDVNHELVHVDSQLPPLDLYDNIGDWLESLK